MPRAISSLLSSGSPTDEREHMPVEQGDASRPPAQNGFPGPESEVIGVQGVELSGVSVNGGRVHGVTSTSETINSSLESAAYSESIDSVVKQTDQIITHVTTTIAEVEERESGDVQDVSIFSETSAGQHRYVARSSIQNGVQSGGSSYQDRNFTIATEAPTSVSDLAVGARRTVVVPTQFSHSSVQERFLEIERLRREETDLMFAVMKGDEEYQRSRQEELDAFRADNERLLQEISASASRITLLENQLNSLTVTTSRHDKVHVHSIITTITTTITSITASITTVTTRIEKWKQTVSKNIATISSKELDQLSSELVNTCSQMTKLQKHYAELSRDFHSVRHELQVMVSVRDAKDRTIASLTAEISQWKNADAGKAGQIRSARQDVEKLRHELSVASSRAAQLQKRHEAESIELSSARKVLKIKTSQIEEKDRTIASLSAEVTRWRQSDTAKAKEITAGRQEHKKLQTDLSLATAKTEEVQKRYDAQSEELIALRKELQTSKSLAEEQKRIITTQAAEVEQWKRADAAKAEQFAAEHRDKEKLQQDLAAFSSQTADLQKRYDTQSTDIVAIRKELQTKVALLEEKEHTISSFTTKIAHAEREIKVKVEQITIAQKETEHLRREFSTASSRNAVLQKRCEAQLKELNSVHDDLHKIEVLYTGGTSHARGEPSKHAIAEQITRALEKKNKEMDALHQELATSTTRNAELQNSYEELLKDVSAVREELKVKTSQDEGNIASLTAQVEQWKRANTTKADQVATTLAQVAQLQQELSTSTSQLTEFQGRYETQSRDFLGVRKELQTATLSNEGKDRTIATLIAEVDQWKGADDSKAGQIATFVKQVEKLQQDASASAFILAELRGRYEAQSRELISIHDELQARTSLSEGKDRTIASLTAEVEQWKREDATKTGKITTTIEQVEELERELSGLTSQLTELQGRYEAQSHELVSVRNELQISISSYEEKDRAVAALNVQVEEWKRTDTLKEERIVTIRKQAEDHQRTLANQISELQQRYDRQSKDLNSLQEHVSGDDRAISSLISQVEEWKRSDATKTDELTIAHRELEQLRHDFVTSSSQIAEFRKRYEAQYTEFTSQIEVWKRSDATKAEELVIARKDLAQLRHDLSVSSSQIIKYQERYAADSASFTSQIERWKRSDAARAVELTTAREKVEQLQRDLSISSSRITEFQQRYDALSVQVEEWKHADATKAEELTRARGDIRQLQHKLSVSSSQIEGLQKYYIEQLEVLRTSSFLSEASRQVYEEITTEVKDYATVIKLATSVDEWLRADAKRAEDLAVELTRRTKENEELRNHLVTLKEIYIRAPLLKQVFRSETVEHHYEEQSATEVKVTVLEKNR